VRVCLDTNVLVAAFATRGLCADVLRTVLAEHELVLGDLILEEFRRALERKLRLPPHRIAMAESVFEVIDRVPKPEEPSPIGNLDPEDRWILAVAVSGRADVLVTGDHDLLEVAGETSMPILTPRAFWELLRAAGP
jgi:putative PIN family toxin of toxin-antitoxin system